MIYIPDEWEGETQKHVMTIQISEHKKLRPGKDFGGYTVLIDGKITHAALTTGPGNAMVDIIINNEPTNNNVINQEYTTFDKPLNIRRGDIIKARVIASSGENGNIIGGNISMLVELV